MISENLKAIAKGTGILIICTGLALLLISLLGCAPQKNIHPMNVEHVSYGHPMHEGFTPYSNKN
jgi:hypothetical protein